MNNTRIQDDLYEAVNGEWLATAVIPADKPRTGGFSTLAEGVEETLMADFREFANGTKTSDVTAVSDAVRLYKKILDKQRRDTDGINPIKPLLAEIASIDTVEKLNSMAKQLVYKGANLPFEFGIDTDMKDATRSCLVMLGPSIILPDTTYYAEDNEGGKQLLAVYADMAAKILALTDLTEQQQKQYLEDTLAFDAFISKKVKSQLEWADYVKNYNPMSVDEVAEYVKPFDLKGLLTSIFGEVEIDKIVVYDPKAIQQMSGYFNEENLQLYVHWNYVKTLLAHTSLLSTDVAVIGNTFSRTLMGVETDPELEKQAYQTASRVFAEPVGVYYGREYFGEEAKKDITDLVKKLIVTWKGRVARNTFLEDATKNKAILKLSTMNIKMGYPDEVREIFKQYAVAEEDSYYDAMSKINTVKLEEEFAKLTKPVDKSQWVMPGHMVNACYDPNRNDITFPAAILQKPFYSIKQTLCENLGGIGAVISHEISHAFDNNGAHFDENGNLNNWWTEKDLANFEALTKDMIEQWDGIDYCGGKVNGTLVVSENIADNGGLAVSLEIMSTLENPNYVEYFTNWAKIWCMKAKEQYIQYLLVNDVHSPAKLRANIAVRNFKEWYDTFNVVSTDEMYIPEDKRIIIW